MLLWWLRDDPQLSKAVRTALLDTSKLVLVSAVVLWEILIKETLGILDVPASLRDEIENQGFEYLPLFRDHIDPLRNLPPHHRDPFDRMLICQAMQEGGTLVTQDQALKSYAVDIFGL